MNPRSAFLYLLSIILTALPIIALIGQHITGDVTDPSAILFFAICFVAAAVTHVFAILRLFKEDEEDLIISRKNSPKGQAGKENSYERSATATKI